MSITKSGGSVPRARSNYALFLGDLSIFCAEKDIEETFQQYGEIVNIRIQRSKETSRALSYGFIEFSCETAAVTAMNELNGFVLKGRPLRIRWAAKRNQPVKSENTALQTAATIFVKFASQTGVIVTEEILRDHFSSYGTVLDTTIRTITIDEAYNRSKGYGFVNFVNSPEEDGLAAAYRASAELQNQTINGVNYRCEVGYKHQQGRSDSDTVSAQSLSTSGNASANVSAAGSQSQHVSQRGFLPSLSPKQMLYSGSSVNSGAAVSQSPSYTHSHSHSSSGPPSPHPAHAGAYFSVNPQAISSGASVVSQGSGSTGMYSQNSPYGPHSPHGHHQVQAIMPTISFVSPTSAPVSAMYPQQQPAQGQQQGMYGQAVPTFPAVSSPHHVQQQGYYAAQQPKYLPAQQPQQFAPPQQQGYYAPQQQGYYGNGYTQQVPYYGSSHSQGGYFAPQQPEAQYYGMPQPEAYGAYYPPQHAGQGYYQPAAQGMPMAPPVPQQNGGMPSPRPPAAVYEAPHLTEHALSQHTRTRRQSVVPQSHAPPNYLAQQGMYGPAPMPVPEVVDGRRSQRNISNKSNISEITSATLNELQVEDDEEVDDEEVPQPPVAVEDAPVRMAVAFAADASAPAPAVASAGTASKPTPDTTNELAATLSSRLKSTLQTQATTLPPVINCKLTARRGKRSVSGGSNTTEITAAVLYDLQMQEQRLEKEEEEEGYTEPPKTAQRNNTPVDADVPKLPCATAATPTIPVATVPTARLTTTPEPELVGAASPSAAVPDAHFAARLTPPSRRRPSVTASISPFTLSAAALAQLQSESEAADAAAGKVPQRRSKRNISDRSNQSDITAALAYMQLEFDESHFRSLDDDGESYSSGHSACVCGKAQQSPAAASCPFGTTACSCVYSATC